ncbi:hypothetical protein EES43_28500 [Streptomyces sp. ADI96-02]|uniref:DUF5133 domain-containing protein n=1 Tax=unclassified Streptomyces TaxID=2593676 RepID=UPI000F55044E|nr:DUF5133 domain-containing protein [Streptomyces sp. ADI96-02]RPK54516.1 hypothetical protein EES43_28500 [Streptomyces sp. ADI96-02]
MLNPRPQDLRAALARYADARIEDDRLPSAATARAVEDATYTLCVMTGTRDVPQALAAADALLERHTAERAGRTAPAGDDKLQAA